MFDISFDRQGQQFKHSLLSLSTCASPNLTRCWHKQLRHCHIQPTLTVLQLCQDVHMMQRINNKDAATGAVGKIFTDFCSTKEAKADKCLFLLSTHSIVSLLIVCVGTVDLVVR